MGGLVTTTEAELVVLSVDGDVLHVAVFELLDHLVDGLDTSLGAGLLGGEAVE